MDARDLTLGQVTAREAECLVWASEGKTDEVIASILGISRSTVIKHIASAREKLGATNKTHAVALALRMGIIEHNSIQLRA